MDFTIWFRSCVSCAVRAAVLGMRSRHMRRSEKISSRKHMKRLKPLCRRSRAVAGRAGRCAVAGDLPCGNEEEQGSFSIDDVCDGVCKKLVTRHPHIFGLISKRILLRKSFLTGRKSNSGKKGRRRRRKPWRVCRRFFRL